MRLLRACALAASLFASMSAPLKAQQSDRPAPKTDAAGPGTLSDKLGATGGVIRPSENVDPHMDKSAPKTPSNSRVIKPPGTEGKPGPTPK